MHTYMNILACINILFFSAFAQKIMWHWRNKNNNNKSLFHFINVFFFFYIPADPFGKSFLVALPFRLPVNPCKLRQVENYICFFFYIFNSQSKHLFSLSNYDSKQCSDLDLISTDWLELETIFFVNVMTVRSLTFLLARS